MPFSHEKSGSEGAGRTVPQDECVRFRVCSVCLKKCAGCGGCDARSVCARLVRGLEVFSGWQADGLDHYDHEESVSAEAQRIPEAVGYSRRGLGNLYQWQSEHVR